jgi:hypothetical protein
MGVLRGLKRNQFNKQRKEIKQQFNQMVKTLGQMQKSCIACEAEFDNKNPEHLDSWRVNVYDDRAELYCDKCYTPTATEISENVNEPETVR